MSSQSAAKLVRRDPEPSNTVLLGFGARSRAWSGRTLEYAEALEPGEQAAGSATTGAPATLARRGNRGEPGVPRGKSGPGSTARTAAGAGLGPAGGSRAQSRWSH